ncbi:MAG: hypothetical protein JST46_01965 [Bacteroidetes bacterium]|nr:hypothetical protein [Bacteroidota bacterium]
MTLVLNANGSGEFDGEPITYSTQGGILAITLNGVTTNYQYKLADNSLTLSGGDLEGAVTFTKGTGSEGPAVAYSNTDKTLLGVWSGNGEMIEFRPDGQCIYLGNTFPYQISQGHVVLTTGQGPVSFGYTVKGQALTLTANGQQVVYYKAQGTESLAAKSVTGKGQVAMELVGQWCYMNMTNNSQTSRCITLNADGTYLYTYEGSRTVNTSELYGSTASQDNDKGTWYVQGDRIYYQSQSKGAGSYRLEKRNHPKNVNDPMIVLDGEPYVTATQKAPWR